MNTLGPLKTTDFFFFFFFGGGGGGGGGGEISELGTLVSDFALTVFCRLLNLEYFRTSHDLRRMALSRSARSARFLSYFRHL